MKTIEEFRRRLARNIAVVGLIIFTLAAGVMLIATCIGVLGMITGELAALHVLALLGMTAGFGILAALCEAAGDLCGANVFK